MFFKNALFYIIPRLLLFLVGYVISIHFFSYEDPYGYSGELDEFERRRLFLQHSLLSMLKPSVRHSGEFERVHKPTMEQFISFVRKGEPFIISGLVDDWKAYREWTDEYFKEKMGDVEVSIEFSKDWKFYGDEGRQKLEQISIREFLEKYRDEHREKNYYLAETSLDNFKPLDGDYPEDPYFIPKSFRQEVRQLWIGPGQQVTPIHHDWFENVLCQFDGSRTFLIYHPYDVDGLYTSEQNTIYPQVSILYPNLSAHPLFKYTKQYKVNLKKGECLYLPYLWWHHVISNPGRSLAINYWYRPHSTLNEMLWMTLSGYRWRKPNEEYIQYRKVDVK